MPEPLSPERESEVREIARTDRGFITHALNDVLAALDAERAKVDGPSGLREQLVAARKGEQIEFRLRQQAERERDAERAKTERLRVRLAYEQHRHTADVEILSGNRDGDYCSCALVGKPCDVALASGEADTDAS